MAVRDLSIKLNNELDSPQECSHFSMDCWSTLTGIRPQRKSAIV